VRLMRIPPWLRRAGASAVAVAVVVIVVGVIVILLIVDYTLSPDSVSLEGPSAIAEGASGNFTIKVTFGDTSSSDRTMQILVYDDDSFGNDLLAKILLTVRSGSKEGTASVRLTCNSGLEGSDGRSDEEDPYHVFAMYDRFFPLTNVDSQIVTVRCGAEALEEETGNGGD
jgi:hypothetical protein